MKALEELRAGIPEYAKDLKLNLQSVLTQSLLDETQRWGVAAATAIADAQEGVANMLPKFSCALGAEATPAGVRGAESRSGETRPRAKASSPTDATLGLSRAETAPVPELSEDPDGSDGPDDPSRFPSPPPPAVEFAAAAAAAAV